MTKRMLIDATHTEETRVAVVDGNRLIDFDYESKVRKQLKGSIFLAKVTRVEPSLQAAFVNFGGNRHGFLPFSEIHPDYFRIPIADREALIAEQEEEMEARRRAEEEENESDSDEDQDEDADLDDDEDDVVELGGADVVLPEGTEQSADDDSDDSDDSGKRGRGRGDKNRGRGRRGRGGRNMPARGRKVEIVGGDGIEGDHPIRPSMRKNYKIQEVIKRGQIMLIQVSKEERGNKGAAVTSYLSLPGRYGVLMPNSPRAGGVSRKIANFKERKRMREILAELSVPQGMSVIMRTAGVGRTKTEIKRDLDYLMRLWDNIRELTLQSSAPALIHEEGNLIRRSIRDIYDSEVEDVLVAGEEGFKFAKDFMKMMIPSHVRRVKQYKDEKAPLFQRYQVENQIMEIGEPTVTLPSGGYLVINPTEALVSVDVNSGRATKERHIEETALKTNLESAVEVARQLKLRDLGGLVVIDFIDMEDRRNNHKVERKLKEALSGDRARIQVGRISSFGLLELSRQRLNPSLTEAQFEKCSHCKGVGNVRTVDAAAISALRALEQEGMKDRAGEVSLQISNAVALYILNNKRDMLADIERRYEFNVVIRVNEDLAPAGFLIEPLSGKSKQSSGSATVEAPVEAPAEASSTEEDDESKQRRQKSRRSRGRRGGRGRSRGGDETPQQDGQAPEKSQQESSQQEASQDEASQQEAPQQEAPQKEEQSKPKPKQEQPQQPEKQSGDDGKAAAKKPARKKAASAKKTKKETAGDAKKAGKTGKADKADKADKATEAEAPAVAASNDEGPQKDYEAVNIMPERKKKRLVE